MRKWSWVLAVLVACGEVHPDSGHVDAATDGATDAATDAAEPIDAPPLVGAHHHFVIDQVLLPATTAQARDYGLDLNGDSTVDNQLGMVIATFAGMGLDSQTRMTTRIDTGATILLADVIADDLVTETPAGFTTYRGIMPIPTPCASPQDTVCRRHLSGSGSFTINSLVPVDAPLIGSILGGVEDAGPGHLTVELVVASSAPILVTLLGARVSLTSTDTTSTGNLAGAISANDIDGKVIPAMREGFETAVQRDCTMLQSPPGCGCAADSEGKSMIGLFDTTPSDCTISLDEVRNSSLIISLLAPDVTVENTNALSLGLRVHAVPATFSDL